MKFQALLKTRNLIFATGNSIWQIFQSENIENQFSSELYCFLTGHVFLKTVSNGIPNIFENKKLDLSNWKFDLRNIPIRNIGNQENKY